MNFIKSLIPDLILVLSLLIEVVAGLVKKLSKSVGLVGLKLHIFLNTDRGQKIVEMQRKIKEMVDEVAKLQKAALANSQENSKLVNAMKAPQAAEETPSNVIVLGKRKNEPTDPKD